MVDTLASGASGGNPVEVQVLSSAPTINDKWASSVGAANDTTGQVRSTASQVIIAVPTYLDLSAESMNITFTSMM